MTGQRKQEGFSLASRYLAAVECTNAGAAARVMSPPVSPWREKPTISDLRNKPSLALSGSGSLSSSGKSPPNSTSRTVITQTTTATTPEHPRSVGNSFSSSSRRESPDRPGTFQRGKTFFPATTNAIQRTHVVVRHDHQYSGEDTDLTDGSSFNSKGKTKSQQEGLFSNDSSSIETTSRPSSPELSPDGDERKQQAFMTIHRIEQNLQEALGGTSRSSWRSRLDGTSKTRGGAQGKKKTFSDTSWIKKKKSSTRQPGNKKNDRFDQQPQRATQGVSVLTEQRLRERAKARSPDHGSTSGAPTEIMSNRTGRSRKDFDQVTDVTGAPTEIITNRTTDLSKRASGLYNVLHKQQKPPKEELDKDENDLSPEEAFDGLTRRPQHQWYTDESIASSGKASVGSWKVKPNSVASSDVFDGVQSPDSAKKKSAPPGKITSKRKKWPPITNQASDLSSMVSGLSNDDSDLKRIRSPDTSDSLPIGRLNNHITKKSELLSPIVKASDASFQERSVSSSVGVETGWTSGGAKESTEPSWVRKGRATKKEPEKDPDEPLSPPAQRRIHLKYNGEGDIPIIPTDTEMSAPQHQSRRPTSDVSGPPKGLPPFPDFPPQRGKSPPVSAVSSNPFVVRYSSRRDSHRIGMNQFRTISPQMSNQSVSSGGWTPANLSSSGVDNDILLAVSETVRKRSDSEVILTPRISGDRDGLLDSIDQTPGARSSQNTRDVFPSSRSGPSSASAVPFGETSVASRKGVDQDSTSTDQPSDERQPQGITPHDFSRQHSLPSNPKRAINDRPYSDPGGSTNYRDGASARESLRQRVLNLRSRYNTSKRLNQRKSLNKASEAPLVPPSQTIVGLAAANHQKDRGEASGDHMSSLSSTSQRYPSSAWKRRTVRHERENDQKVSSNTPGDSNNKKNDEVGDSGATSSVRDRIFAMNDSRRVTTAGLGISSASQLHNTSDRSSSYEMRKQEQRVQSPFLPSTGRQDAENKASIGRSGEATALTRRLFMGSSLYSQAHAIKSPEEQPKGAVSAQGEDSLDAALEEILDKDSLSVDVQSIRSMFEENTEDNDSMDDDHTTGSMSVDSIRAIFESQQKDGETSADGSDGDGSVKRMRTVFEPSTKQGGSNFAGNSDVRQAWKNFETSNKRSSFPSGVGRPTTSDFNKHNVDAISRSTEDASTQLSIHRPSSRNKYVPGTTSLSNSRTQVPGRVGEEASKAGSEQPLSVAERAKAFSHSRTQSVKDSKPLPRPFEGKSLPQSVSEKSAPLRTSSDFKFRQNDPTTERFNPRSQIIRSEIFPDDEKTEDSRSPERDADPDREFVGRQPNSRVAQIRQSLMLQGKRNRAKGSASSAPVKQEGQSLQGSRAVEQLEVRSKSSNDPPGRISAQPSSPTKTSYVDKPSGKPSHGDSNALRFNQVPVAGDPGAAKEVRRDTPSPSESLSKDSSGPGFIGIRPRTIMDVNPEKALQSPDVLQHKTYSSESDKERAQKDPGDQSGRSFLPPELQVARSSGESSTRTGSEFDDGVTLDLSIAEVSGLTTPTCIRSKEELNSSSSEATSEQTSDVAGAAENEGRGPSEASSSQTSEAAAPLIAKMNFSSSDANDTTDAIFDGKVEKGNSIKSTKWEALPKSGSGVTKRGRDQVEDDSAWNMQKLEASFPDKESNATSAKASDWQPFQSGDWGDSGASWKVWEAPSTRSSFSHPFDDENAGFGKSVSEQSTGKKKNFSPTFQIRSTPVKHPPQTRLDKDTRGDRVRAGSYHGVTIQPPPPSPRAPFSRTHPRYRREGGVAVPSPSPRNIPPSGPNRPVTQRRKAVPPSSVPERATQSQPRPQPKFSSTIEEREPSALPPRPVPQHTSTSPPSKQAAFMERLRSIKESRLRRSAAANKRAALKQEGPSVRDRVAVAKSRFLGSVTPPVVPPVRRSFSYQKVKPNRRMNSAMVDPYRVSASPVVFDDEHSASTRSSTQFGGYTFEQNLELD